LGQMFEMLNNFVVHGKPVFQNDIYQQLVTATISASPVTISNCTSLPCLPSFRNRRRSSQ
jgi:hypothetical protein